MKSVTFAPLEARPPRLLADEAQHKETEKDLSLHEEPAEEILLLGLMIHDVKIMADMLRDLAYENATNYRGNLRVVSGAAERLRQRCTRLIGDADSDPSPPEKKRAAGAGSR